MTQDYQVAVRLMPQPNVSAVVYLQTIGRVAHLTPEPRQFQRTQAAAFPFGRVDVADVGEGEFQVNLTCV